MILYHVTNDLDHDGYFYPRIPLQPSQGECLERKRISFSSTIIGAFTALPRDSSTFDDLFVENKMWKIFRLDTDKHDINKITPPEELYKKDLVRDALITKEHWVFATLKIKDFEIIEMHDWVESAVDLHGHEVIEEAEKKGVEPIEVKDGLQDWIPVLDYIEYKRHQV